ncbi:MAG: hypothetical protein H6574_18760 [Lewinellaceae bacterium]|nr:hypothetical protein [Lewinellaceae bacterium]
MREAVKLLIGKAVDASGNLKLPVAYFYSPKNEIPTKIVRNLNGKHLYQRYPLIKNRKK